ncbi:PspA/IM30 family protein [Mycobacterium kyorinense]|uniref:PspA/IM30 family protein n=1 Tax=Mycobacterium kyorinense TaxID=487514 RepID=UPI000AACE2C3|nr:PspA/IM30 family protein [Mycobacterium kyorinense]
MNGSARSTPRTQPPQRKFGGLGFGWLACGVVGVLAIAWFIFLGPGESGSKAEWFFGAAVFGVVLVSLWQTVTIQRQASQKVAEAAEQLRRELVAAEERSAREVAITRRLHQEEMEAKQNLHRAEMEAQRELARVERMHLLKRLQKQAMIEVSRAVGAHTQMLAALWNEAAGLLRIEDRDERELAMNPIFEQIGQVVNDFSIELANAHLLVEDDHLHRALDRVNEAAVMAVQVAQDIHTAVIEGHAPEPNPIPSVQRLMHARAADARRLAWELLRTGLDDHAQR